MHYVHFAAAAAVFRHFDNTKRSVERGVPLSRAAQLRPARLEIGPHVVAGLADRGLVLVESLAVVENESSVGRKVLAALVSGGRKDYTVKSSLSLN